MSQSPLNPRPLGPSDFTPTMGEELLPREVGKGLADFGLFAEKIPPYFKAAGIYDQTRDKFMNLLAEEDGDQLGHRVRACAHDFIRYDSLRDSNVPRSLGIPHPESNTLLAIALEEKWQQIRPIIDSSQPQPSRIYPRRINGENIIDLSYDDDDGEEEEEAKEEQGDGQDEVIFQMNFKGPEQWTCEELELEWRATRTWKVSADISACFPSIYTHSLPWALHGWQATKDNHCPATFLGNLLDRCAQANRDKQTNGLLIGPHASNVLSEIILGQIDQMLIDKGYSTYFRHIDDYVFYAETREEGEHFIRQLSLSLRKFQLGLNEKKTSFHQLPIASQDDWLSRLKRFRFPPLRKAKREGDPDHLIFNDIRPLLDLALDLAKETGKSTPLSYALKMVPTDLNIRGKRLFLKEAAGLGLKFPYLASFLVKDIFPRFVYPGHKNDKIVFASALWQIGIQRIYPDAVAHALYLALEYSEVLKGKNDKPFLTDEELLQTLELGDCICHVLLWEYGEKFERVKIKRKVKGRACLLKTADHRTRDQFWLLLYWLWSEEELRGSGQTFLADLKSSNFSFKRQAPESEAQAS